MRFVRRSSLDMSYFLVYKWKEKSLFLFNGSSCYTSKPTSDFLWFKLLRNVRLVYLSLSCCLWLILCFLVTSGTEPELKLCIWVNDAYHSHIPPIILIFYANLCAGGGERGWYGWTEDKLHPYQASSRRSVLPFGVSKIIAKDLNFVCSFLLNLSLS